MLNHYLVIGYKYVKITFPILHFNSVELERMKLASSKPDKLIKLKNISHIRIYFQGVQRKRHHLKKKHYEINFNNVHSFYLGEVLGSGSFGTVYKAFYPKFKRFICFKVQDIKYNLVEYNSIKHIFNTLAPNTSSLIGPCYAGYFSRTDAALLLPFYPEGSLLDLVNRHRQTRTWIKPLTALKFTHQLIFILLILLKSNCSHNDIKSDNLMLRKGNLVLIDFGKARILSESPYNQFSHALDFGGAADTLYTIITLNYRSDLCKLNLPRSLKHLEKLMTSLMNFLSIPQTCSNQPNNLNNMTAVQILTKFESQIRKEMDSEQMM